VPVIAVTPDIFREIHVKRPGRTFHRYRGLPETIEVVEENTHKHIFRVGSFQPLGGEPFDIVETQCQKNFGMNVGKPTFVLAFLNRHGSSGILYDL